MNKARIFNLLSVSILLLAAGRIACAQDQPLDKPCELETKKFNPGHYVAVVRKDTDQDIAGALRTGVRGFQQRYTWAGLEPEQGAYNFQAIRDDLSLAAENDVQLVVLVEDKSFRSANPVPSYLREYAVQNRKGGWTVARWDSIVVERLQALLVALGSEFDCEPNFEGVAIQESAPGLDDVELEAAGYTPEKYRDALVELLTAAAESSPHSQVFWYMNFLPGKQAYLSQIARKVAPLGVAMGGPDVLPENSALVRRTYPLYGQHQDEMTLFNSMQFNSYEHRRVDVSAGGKYWSMEELFAYARDRLHVNYLFWNHKTWSKPPGSWNWDDALDVIEKNPDFNTE